MRFWHPPSSCAIEKAKPLVAAVNSRNLQSSAIFCPVARFCQPDYGLRRAPLHRRTARGGAMIEEKDVRVAMRDGVKIALRIYRPDGSGPFPALFAASPYRYDNNELPAQPM